MDKYSRWAIVIAIGFLFLGGTLAIVDAAMPKAPVLSDVKDLTSLKVDKIQNVVPQNQWKSEAQEQQLGDVSFAAAKADVAVISTVSLKDSTGSPLVDAGVAAVNADGQQLRSRDLGNGLYAFEGSGFVTFHVHHESIGNTQIELKLNPAAPAILTAVSRPGGPELVDENIRTFSRTAGIQGAVLVGGEDCSDAEPITGLPYTDTGNTCDYDNDYDEVCPYSGSLSEDVVYEYTPANDILVSCSLCQPSSDTYDTKMYVYENDCSGAYAWCNDDGCSSPDYVFASEIEDMAMTAGNTYYIVVDGYSSQCGDYELTCIEEVETVCVECEEDDTFEDEPNCGLPDSTNGGCNSSPPVFGTIECGESICGSNAFNGSWRDTDWFLFETTEAFTLHHIGIAEYPSQPLIVQHASGDINNPCGGSLLIQAFAFVDECENYDISYLGAPGVYSIWMGSQFVGNIPCPSDYDIELECVPFVPAENDECVDAINIDPIPSLTPGSTTNALNSAEAGFCGTSNYVSGDVWYSVTGTGNTMTTTTCEANGGGANFDTTLNVYCGGCDPFPAGLYCVTGNDDSCPSPNFLHSTASWCSEPGREYLIMVGGFSTATGDFDLYTSDNGVECDESQWPICEPCIECEDTEGEPNCGLPDSTNGGCNYFPALFSPLDCGDEVCGSGAFNGSWRDTDWFEITFTQPTKYTWTVQSMFEHLQGYIDGGGEDCSQTTGYVEPYALGDWCETTSITDIIASTPSTHWFFVAPQFTQILGCPAQYEAVMECETLGACCLSDESCIDAQTESDCETVWGGEAWIEGEGCGGEVLAEIAPVGVFTDISATGTIANNASNNFDSGDQGIGIGFAFTYYGESYSEVGISSKGYINVTGDSVGDYTPDPFPSSNLPNGVIGAWWGDLNPAAVADGQVRYQTMGAVGDRIFIVQWTNVPHYFNDGTDNTFQIQLYEADNHIEFHYLQLFNPFGYTHTQGIEDATGSQGMAAPNPLNNNLAPWAAGIMVLPDPCNLPPVCDADGPYDLECGGSVAVDASGTYDPGDDDFVVFWENVDCPSGMFDDPDDMQANFTATGITECPTVCTIKLTATDLDIWNPLSSECFATVTIDDNMPPLASCELVPTGVICPFPHYDNPIDHCNGQWARIDLGCADDCDDFPMAAGTLNGVPVADGENVFVMVPKPFKDCAFDVMYPEDEKSDCPYTQFCGKSFELLTTCTDVCGNTGECEQLIVCQDEDEDDDGLVGYTGDSAGTKDIRVNPKTLIR
jgi:hypothetical protein